MSFDIDIVNGKTIEIKRRLQKEQIEYAFFFFLILILCRSCVSRTAFEFHSKPQQRSNLRAFCLSILRDIEEE